MINVLSIYSIKKRLAQYCAHLPGWRTNRKIVVIESDDWGSIRMPSKVVLNSLLNKGIRVDQLPYNKYDALASEEDLEKLFEVLWSVKDKNGNPAQITANTIVANPDFEKIERSGFQEYYFEPFTKTLQRYPRHSNSFFLWQQGIQERVFKPQLHGREHLNVVRWLNALKNNTGNVRFAFDYKMFDLSESLTISENSFMEAFNFESLSELDFQKQAIDEGASLFEELFGYRSRTFIAPCYIWSSKLSKAFKEYGIEGFQGGWFQKEPVPGRKHRFKKRFNYTGKKTREGQVFLVRNVFFEPSQNRDVDFVNDALVRIKTAFNMGKPAIISSHRLNFIGYIDSSNRDRNLPQLKKLLNTITTRWPEVEFMSSDQLLEMILGNE